MRRTRAASDGLTLVELGVATSIFAIVMLVGYVSWEMGWRGMRDEQNATLAYQNAFNALHTMEEQVQRSNTIQVPDPDNATVPSIQLTLSLNGTTVRRAYRLSGSNLLMQWKDEGFGPKAIFTGVSSLTFTMLDAPNNTMVQLACSCTTGSRTVQMQTVAWRRN